MKPSVFSRRDMLLFAVSGLALSGCTLFGGGGSVDVIAVSEAQAQSKINALRRQNGVGPVSPARRLEIVASQQARLMAENDELTHEVRMGMGLAGRIARAGYQGISGENISAGYDTLDRALAGWMASPGHRRNMLDPRFTEFGIAAARVGDGRASRFGTYWALVFGGPATRVNAGQA
jgi:uncharacterized protein YkwD